MAPFGDAVRFIDGIERNPDVAQEGHILRLGKRLGSHIENLGLSAEQVFLHLIHLLFV